MFFSYFCAKKKKLDALLTGKCPRVLFNATATCITAFSNTHLSVVLALEPSRPSDLGVTESVIFGISKSRKNLQISICMENHIGEKEYHKSQKTHPSVSQHHVLLVARKVLSSATDTCNTALSNTHFSARSTKFCGFLEKNHD